MIAAEFCFISLQAKIKNFEKAVKADFSYTNLLAYEEIIPYLYHVWYE